jgi:phospholipid transport system substrate-binding protein
MHTARATHIVAVVGTFAAVLGPAPFALGSGPAEEITTQIDRVGRIMKDPALQGEAQRDSRRLAVRRVVEEVFDFDETARRALGRHWDERSPEERATFVRLFTALIDRAYLSRLDGFEHERLVVVSDEVNGSRAVVRVHVMTAGASPLPIDLHLIHSADRWRVWDARLEGASLVSSYRVQFQKVIQSASWEELLRRLETKTAQP